MSSITVGRDKEIKYIHNQFDLVCEDKFKYTSVVGPSGCGKTHLINMCQNYFSKSNATFVNIKFDQYRKNDYTTIIDLIDQLCQRIMTLPHDAYQMVLNDLADSLSSDIESLTLVSKYASKIFSNDKNNINIHPTNIKYDGLKDALYKLFIICARVFFPLVLFVDDVQWADKSNISLLEKIKDNGIICYMLLAYRDNENNIIHLNNFSKNTIKLKELSQDDIVHYIEQMFGEKILGIKELAYLVFSITKGNAFYVNQAIQQIKSNRIISKNNKDDSWIIDRNKVSQIDITEDMENRLISQIMNLKKQELLVMQTLSCFGSKTSYFLLLFASGMDKAGMSKILKNLKPFLFVYKQGEKAQVCFVHDIIYKVVCDTLEKSEKQKMCSDILFTIENYPNKDMFKKHSYDILPIIVCCDKNILKNKEDNFWVEILFKGAIEAKNIQAFRYSIKILSLCEYLTKDQNNDLSIIIQLEYMQLEFITENHKKSEKRYLELCKNHSTKQDLIQIKLRYMYFYSYSANWEMVLEQGKEILCLLNCRFNKRYTSHNLIRSLYLYTNKNVDSILYKNNLTDKRMLTILEVLVIMFPAANRIDIDSFNLINIKLANMVIKQGNSPYSAIGYSAYCYILTFIFQDLKKANNLQHRTLTLLKDNTTNCKKSIPYALIGTFTYHWMNDFNSTLDILNKSIIYGEKENEYLYSNYAIVFSIITKYVSGCSLDFLSSFINNFKAKKRRLENYLTRQMYNVYTSHINYLKTGEETYTPVLEKDKEAFFETIELNANMLKVHRYFIEGKYEEAYKLILQNQQAVWTMKGFILNGDFDFYSILVRISYHYNLDSSNQNENIKVIKRLISELKKWANTNQSNHVARYKVAKNMYDNCFNSTSSDDEYYEAIKVATFVENIQLEALINLILSRKYNKKNTKLSMFFANEAIKLYYNWGALFICESISRITGIKFEHGKEHPKNTVKNEKKAVFDLNKLETQDQQAIFEYSFEYLKKSYNIEYSYMLLEESTNMLVYYHNNQNDKKPASPQNINYFNNIPANLIRYVSRYEKTMRIDKNNENEFLLGHIEKTEIHKTNYYAMPIKNQNILIGIFYFVTSKQNPISKAELNEISNLIDYISDRIKLPSHNTPKVKTALTSREIDILKLVAAGLSNMEISSKLYISNGTVRNHLSNIYDKLDAGSRIQAIIKAKDLSLI